ncbi:hypothetical protein K1T35_10415 [Pseudonocardia sp. DSM 110487]|uniref:hypothetical protein n=1 Tax=Pseudonocardia sp. DSM 110487 TaxID=2865833 RepID=UPI001C696A72|nr:hypothetical protein [Pseudonocardia sp. DSM 110487]QYN37610.1 hypothetical protein K1T35_10415 [Pseudonocardia sp. DSM 110487]
MTRHETRSRWAATLRTALRLGREAGRALDGRTGARSPANPIARDAARWRH